jgi:uncharacterized protein (TIGR02646 family)
MLYIEKKMPTVTIQQQFAQLKGSAAWRAIPEGDTKAIRAYFDQIDKACVRESLLEEQHYLCAYCMRRIDNSLHTQIEHFVPLSKSKEDALNYNNLFAVCDGGATAEVKGKRILCCDGSKKDEDALTLNPTNQALMQCVQYNKSGILSCDLSSYSKETRDAIEHDINVTLKLNGEVIGKGQRKDTATQIIKGRRDAYIQSENVIKRLFRKGTLTSAQLEKEIRKIETAKQRQPYAGVIIFFLKRKQNALQREKI